jgi:hypothetical protein
VNPERSTPPCPSVSAWRSHTNAASYTAATALFSSALYSIYAPLSDSTGLSIDQLNVGTGYSYLFIGLGTLIFQPAALAFGKRPVYLVTSLVTAALNIWTVFVQGNGQWIARCILLGLFGAPNFSLIEVSIADLVSTEHRALSTAGHYSADRSCALTSTSSSTMSGPGLWAFTSACSTPELASGPSLAATSLRVWVGRRLS